MPGQRPTLITDNSTSARQVRADVADRLKRPVTHCTYDDCRRQIAWHKEGVLLLLAPEGGDLEPLAGLVRECHLRRSPLTVGVLQAGPGADDAALAPLDPYVAARLPWPGAAGELAGLAGPAPAGGDREESLADVLAGRLQALTPSLAPLAGRLAVAALHDVTVLLTGETGTGKTFLGRLLHDHSPRRGEPFLMVPCGAQPAELFESAFFGHVKGAFTGAHQAQAGKFAAAGKGTILLDEIDTLGLEQQAALLRVIETGEYERVGCHQTLKSEARLIVASNWDLEGAVERGEFRQDLYYRLNVMAFHLPPLRERAGDIPLLARGFAAQFAAKFHKPLLDITPEALQALTAFPWPGNVRQLENAVQQAVLVCPGPELAVHDLPDTVRRHTTAAVAAGGPPAGAPAPGHLDGNGPSAAGSLLRNRAEYERTLIQQTLEACQNNRSSAARALGISRVTLHKKIKQYGLKDRPRP
jgi:DNA-binding NtrC family response regulator